MHNGSKDHIMTECLPSHGKNLLHALHQSRLSMHWFLAVCENLALVWAVMEFAKYLNGVHFDHKTDYLPLA